MNSNLKNLFSGIKLKSGKFTCPYCYAEHDINECGLKCSYNIIGKTDNCKYGIPKDKDGWIPLAYKKKCVNCKEAAKQLFCDDTKKEIPIEFLSMRSLPIALLGAKASGKSNYIGVLINEIRKRMANPFNCSLTMTCSQESKQAYNDFYYRPLYEDGYTVRATDAGEVPPLIFPLRFMDKKNRIANMAALTFYDTAGENLDNKDIMNKFNKYIKNARGIILLLDPLQVPDIRKELTNKGFNSLPEKNTDISEVLDMIIKVIEGYKNKIGEIDIPLALVFTKIDVLEQYNILPADSCLREESEHVKTGKFVKKDFENTDMHMQDLIGNWLDDELLKKINQFKQHSFFGATSLGANPTDGGTKIDKSKGIHPRRVLDPLLWLLAENGYISTLKE